MNAKIRYGILNGVDYSRWNSTSDPYIESFFDIDDLTGKISCKKSARAVRPAS